MLLDWVRQDVKFRDYPIWPVRRLDVYQIGPCATWLPKKEWARCSLWPVDGLATFNDCFGGFRKADLQNTRAQSQANDRVADFSLFRPHSTILETAWCSLGRALETKLGFAIIQLQPQFWCAVLSRVSNQQSQSLQ